MKDRIKSVRKSRNYSQDAFASDLGVSLANIKSYETGRRNPSDSFIQLICTKYNVNETWLRTGDGDMFAPMTRQQELAQIASSVYKNADDEFILKTQLFLAQMDKEQIKLLKGFILDFADYIKKDID